MFDSKGPIASILLVEDDEDYRSIILGQLLEHEYQVEVASSYEEAKQILDRMSFDVAIVDLKLQEDDPSNRDGIKVVAYIREVETKRTSVLIWSGHGNIELVKTAFKKYDVLDFLEKGGGFSEMVQSILDAVKDAVQRSKPLDEPKDIFISYARADLYTTQTIYKALTCKKFHPWMDIYSIRGGENWLRAIYQAINESQIFLAILSNNSVSRRGVIQKELKKALNKWNGMLPDDIYLIPVRIDDCPIPELLKHIQVLDWNSGKGENKLLEAIRVGLARRKNG